MSNNEQAIQYYCTTTHKSGVEAAKRNSFNIYNHETLLKRPIKVIRCKIEIGMDINTIINMYIKDKPLAYLNPEEILEFWGHQAIVRAVSLGEFKCFTDLGVRMRLVYDKNEYNNISDKIKNSFNMNMCAIAEFLSGWEHVKCEWVPGLYKRIVDYNMYGEVMSVEKEEYYFGKFVIECSNIDIPDLVRFFDIEVGTDKLYDLNKQMIKILNPYGFKHRGYKDLDIYKSTNEKDIEETDMIELNDNTLSISLLKPYVDTPKFSPWQIMWYHHD